MRIFHGSSCPQTNRGELVWFNVRQSTRGATLVLSFLNTEGGEHQRYTRRYGGDMAWCGVGGTLTPKSPPSE